MSREQPIGTRIFGYLLLLLGAVWVLLSGGCTLAFVGIAGGNARGGDMQALSLLLVLGAVCILPGAGLLYGGWVVLRKRTP